MYPREQYLKELISKKENGRIKIITGLRRSGKSVLLFQLYREWLLNEGVKEDQIIALAYGAKTYKLKFGHRGGNHPVQDLESGKIEITSQNHSFAVEEESLAQTPLMITHRNLLDGTVEGMKCEKDRVFSVQYHPESCPGPQDSMYLFDRFLLMMEENRTYGKENGYPQNTCDRLRTDCNWSGSGV